jgi:HK97 family phage major capsid protein
MNQQYKRYSDEADKLTQGVQTPQTRARLQFLLSAMSTMREFGMNNETRTASHGASDFRKKFLSEEARTYTPISEISGASLIPGDFEVQLKSLMLADGPLYSGSPLLTNLYAKTMTATKIAVNDDTNVGSIAVENAGFPSDDAELTGLSGVTIGNNSKRYSSGILLASMELASDAPNFDAMIAKDVAPRLSRIQNSTNLTALKTALALNGSAAVSGLPITAASVYALVSAVASPYRSSPSAAFIMSSAQQTAIGALVTSSGLREFPDVLKASPSVLGFPVHIIGNASSTDILFGDWSYFYTKSTPAELRVLRERFILNSYYGYLLSVRAQAVWTAAATSDSPVKYLTA